MVSEAGLGRTLVFFLTVGSFRVFNCPVRKERKKARELTLVNFFSRLWGNKAILLGIWVDWTLAILFISYFFVQQMVVPGNYYFLFIF